MNKHIKFGLMAVALAMVAPAIAQQGEVVENEDEVVGWTPIAFGLASPVQLPWGHAKWDVFGLDLNLLYSGAPKMYGLGIGGLAMTTADDMMGLQVSGLCNWNAKDVYGMRVTLGANFSFGTTYGWDAGGFAYREGEMWGLDTEFIGSYQKDFWGAQFSGIVNFTDGQSYGWTTSIGGNMAQTAYGLQLAGVFNFTEELHGFQIGIVNFAKECPWGLQIGIVNVIMDNKIKVLPIVNCYF